MRSVDCLFVALASAAAQATAAIGASWPAEPVQAARRMLQAEAPSYDSIAEYNIILFSSLGMVAVFFFAASALMNMDVGNDSLLYSKTKSD